jgi:hypothetical protein
MGEILDLDSVVIKIKLNKKNNMLAQVELQYGTLRIFGYRVMQSGFNDGLFIQPPSVKIGSKWLWLVRVDNPEMWNDLQEMIKSAYQSAIDEHTSGISDIELEDVNI